MKKIIIFLLFLFSTCFFTNTIFAIDQININTATLAQLDTLTGIGPVYAQRIIDARPFSSIDDLDRVKGIGPATVQKIKDQGLACANCNNQNPTPTPITLEPAPTTIYSSGIYINEILPNPEGTDETEEWIELYNSSNIEIDLSGWLIKDITGTVTIFTIKRDTKISGNGFLVFKRPETKIMLNNDEDGVSLLTPDNKTVDTINYLRASLGQSYNKISAGWAWSTTLTAGAKNIVITKVLPAPATPKTLRAGLSKTNNFVKNNVAETRLADLSQTLNINQDKEIINPWFLFLIALGTTIILAVVVILIKLKILKKYVRT